MLISVKQSSELSPCSLKISFGTPQRILYRCGAGGGGANFRTGVQASILKTTAII